MNTSGLISIDMVIGLPGCGRMHYLAEYPHSHLHANKHIIVIDNCLSDIMWFTKVKEEIAKTTTPISIVVSDTRFCLPNIFKRNYARLRSLVDAADLKVIYFDNNPEQCANSHRQLTKSEYKIWSDAYQHTIEKELPRDSQLASVVSIY